MYDPWKSYRDLTSRVWTDLLIAQLQAATTITRRTAILFDRTTVGARRRADLESRRMVAEKIRAFGDGAVDAMQEALRTSPSQMRDGPASAEKATRIGRAFLDPALHRVARNARRLNK